MEKSGPSRLSFSLVDLFDDRTLVRLNHVGSVVALDIAILPQRRRFPIDLLGERSDLHRIRQAITNAGPGRRGVAAGGALFWPGRPGVLANDCPVLVGIGHLA